MEPEQIILEMFESEKIHLPARPGEARITKADISKTTKKTGWTPKHKLKDYIKEIINEL